MGNRSNAGFFCLAFAIVLTIASSSFAETAINPFHEPGKEAAAGWQTFKTANPAILCCADVCANANYHRCMSEALCTASCTENLWSWEYRNCVDTFASVDTCDKCPPTNP
ncbi:MAG TPA: hypothetical protein PK961_07105 [bacterium]|mgnify:CR=1 FL=1|nr:hypothetical protein [bacterium]